MLLLHQRCFATLFRLLVARSVFCCWFGSICGCRCIFCCCRYVVRRCQLRCCCCTCRCHVAADVGLLFFGVEEFGGAVLPLLLACLLLPFRFCLLFCVRFLRLFLEGLPFFRVVCEKFIDGYLFCCCSISIVLQHCFGYYVNLS